MAAAASECGEDTGMDTNRCLAKDTVTLLSKPQANCLSNDRLESMTATFFMTGKRSGLCRCFGSHSVVSLDVHALDTVHCSVQTSTHVEFPQMSEESDDNCRKKRCTDRYDSSESSDSGVAALSSSSTSDITDPGSPFSTASTHSSNSESGDDKSSSYQSSYPSTPVKSPHRWAPRPLQDCHPPLKPSERNFAVADTARPVWNLHLPSPGCDAVACDIAHKSEAFVGDSASSVGGGGRQLSASSDKRDVSQAPKISPTVTSCASSAVQTRRASATRQCSGLVSNVFTNTGSSFAGGNDARKKDGSSETKSDITGGNPQLHASENETLKIGTMSSVQTRNGVGNVPTSNATTRNGVPSVNSKKPSVSAEETTTGTAVSADKARSTVWNGSMGIPDASKMCEMLPLTTIALTVPTYCILTASPIDSHHNQLLAAKTSCTPEGSPVSLPPGPRTYHWTTGTNTLGPTLKPSNFKPFLVTGNSLLSQRKCILLAAPTGPSLGSMTGVPTVVGNGVTGLIPVVKGSGSGCVATGGGASQVGLQVRILGKANVVPNPPRVEPTEPRVETADSLVPTESSPPLWAAATVVSPNRSNVRKSVTTKTVPPAKVKAKPPPNKRLKPDSLPTQPTAALVAARTVVRSVCVTRQQTQRCSVSLQKLPAHSHNTRKCTTADKAKGAPQQGKITEYFKTQVKPLNSVKKDLSADFGCPNGAVKKTLLADVQNGEPANGLDSYFSLISPPLSKIAKKSHNAATSKNASPITSPVQIFLLNKLESDSRVTKLLGNHKAQASPATSPRKSSQPPSPKAPERINGTVANAPLMPLFLTPANRKPLKKGPLSPKQSALLMKCANANQTAKSASPSSCLAVSGCAAKASPSVIEPPLTAGELETMLDRSISDTLASFSGDSESNGPFAHASGGSAAATPIAPQTIRFPATQCKSMHAHLDEEKLTCRWADCSDAFDTSTVLMEHLQTQHVVTQAGREHYVCLWVGCKVYSRTSCSQSWLERHVLSHGGNKPFRCIVDGCGQRFGSNTALERHVNGHFDQEGGGAGGSGQGPRRSLDGAAGKMLRRNGKKLRYRKQPWSARMFDYFDAGIMEILQHRLLGMTEARTSGVDSAPGNTIVLNSKVMARRIAPDGTTRFLLRWFPEDVLEDEWVSQSQVTSTRTVPISRLTPTASAQLHTPLCITNTSAQHRKHRRKPPRQPPPEQPPEQPPAT